MACSNSQRKRLAIALSLLGESKVIFLDAPTSGMDLRGKHLIWTQIRKIRQNKVVVVATNDMIEAKNLADRVGIIEAGKLVLCGSWDFFEKHTQLPPTVFCKFKLAFARTDEEKKHEEDKLRALVTEEYKDAVHFKWELLNVLIIQLPQMEGAYRIKNVLDFDALLAMEG